MHRPGQGGVRSFSGSWGEIGFDEGVAGFVDLTLGIDVDEYFDAGKLALELRLDRVHHVMRLRHRHAGIDPDMELDEILGAASAGTTMVKIGRASCRERVGKGG